MTNARKPRKPLSEADAARAAEVAEVEMATPEEAAEALEAAKSPAEKLQERLALRLHVTDSERAEKVRAVCEADPTADPQVVTLELLQDEAVARTAECLRQEAEALKAFQEAKAMLQARTNARQGAEWTEHELGVALLAFRQS